MNIFDFLKMIERINKVSDPTANIRRAIEKTQKPLRDFEKITNNLMSPTERIQRIMEGSRLSGYNTITSSAIAMNQFKTYGYSSQIAILDSMSRYRSILNSLKVPSAYDVNNIEDTVRKFFNITEIIESVEESEIANLEITLTEVDNNSLTKISEVINERSDKPVQLSESDTKSNSITFEQYLSIIYKILSILYVMLNIYTKMLNQIDSIEVDFSQEITSPIINNEDDFEIIEVIISLATEMLTSHYDEFSSIATSPEVDSSQSND